MTLTLKGLALAAALVLGGLAAPAQAMPLAGQLGCSLCPSVDGSESLVQQVARGSGRSRMGGSMYRPGRMGGGHMYRSRGSYGPRAHYRSRGSYGSRAHYRSRAGIRPDRRWDRRRHGHNHHWRRHRHRHGGHGFGFYGYYDPFYYGYDPYYYAGYGPYYGYDDVYADAEVDDYAGGSDYNRYCKRKHPSFNARTGRYRTYSGKWRKCVYRG